MISTATPSRRPSSRPRSTATPRNSPVAGSFAVSRKLPRLMPTRSLPVGASSERMAGVHSVIAVTCDVEILTWSIRHQSAFRCHPLARRKMQRGPDITDFQTGPRQSHGCYSLRGPDKLCKRSGATGASGEDRHVGICLSIPAAMRTPAKFVQSPTQVRSRRVSAVMSASKDKMLPGQRQALSITGVYLLISGVWVYVSNYLQIG